MFPDQIRPENGWRVPFCPKIGLGDDAAKNRLSRQGGFFGGQPVLSRVFQGLEMADSREFLASADKLSDHQLSRCDFGNILAVIFSFGNGAIALFLKRRLINRTNGGCLTKSILAIL